MINGVSQPTVQQTGLTDGGSIDQTKSQFLQLLLTQLQHQDPLSPADTDQMTGQMMSLGQLEQLFDINEKMGSMVNLQSGTMLAQYSGMVGHKALAQGNVMQVDDVDKGQFNFYLPKMPVSSQLRVFDQFNNLVREIDFRPNSVGMQTMPFDGLNKNGTALPNGYYKFLVNALDAEGNGISVETFSQGQISSIRLEGGQPIFQMGSNDVKISEIEKVY